MAPLLLLSGMFPSKRRSFVVLGRRGVVTESGDGAIKVHGLARVAAHVTAAGMQKGGGRCVLLLLLLLLIGIVRVLWLRGRSRGRGRETWIGNNAGDFRV